jgi:hypothetical protein
MKKTIIIFLSIILLYALTSKPGYAYSYLITAKVSVPFWVTKYVQRTKKVKERKAGRWVYLKKKIKCPKRVKKWKVVELTDVIVAASLKKAYQVLRIKYRKRGYTRIKILKAKRIK